MVGRAKLTLPKTAVVRARVSRGHLVVSPTNHFANVSFANVLGQFANALRARCACGKWNRENRKDSCLPVISAFIFVLRKHS